MKNDSEKTAYGVELMEHVRRENKLRIIYADSGRND